MEYLVFIIIGVCFCVGDVDWYGVVNGYFYSSN